MVHVQFELNVIIELFLVQRVLQRFEQVVIKSDNVRNETDFMLKVHDDKQFEDKQYIKGKKIS